MDVRRAKSIVVAFALAAATGCGGDVVPADVGAPPARSPPPRSPRSATPRDGRPQADAPTNAEPAQVVLAAGAIVDEAGKPLVGWHVIACAIVDGEATSSEVESIDTDADGRFRLTSWKPRDVAIAVYDRDGLHRRIETQSVDPATGLARIVIDSPGLIAGRVVAEHGGDVRGAVVHLRRVGDDIEQTAVVDASGDFVFKKLDAASSYRLSAECAGFIEEPREGDCAVDRLDVRIWMTKTEGVMAGRLLDAADAPRRAAWLRFVAVDGKGGFQLMTDDDGGFKTYEARDVDYDVSVLTSAADGRLVPGAPVGRCHGGATWLLFRAPR